MAKIVIGFANVAAFVLDCLEDDRYVREMPKVADER